MFGCCAAPRYLPNVQHARGQWETVPRETWPPLDLEERTYTVFRIN